jgi:hypothetical protein
MQPYKRDITKLASLEKTKKIFIDVCNNTIQDEDINYKDCLHGTPLTWAAILGKYETVQQLINRGADPNVKVFSFLFQVIKIDWILDPALSFILPILPIRLRKFLNKDILLYIFKTLKQYGYIDNDGIYLKYLINILVETTKYPCYNRSMLSRWATQEDFDRKIKLTFWFYPKMVDSNNYFIQKFFKNPITSERLRYELINTFSNNPHESYKKIEKLIPLNRTKIDQFLNNKWDEIIIPHMIYGIIVRIICEDNIN